MIVVKAAIYARVSTAEQNWEMQVTDLTEFVGRMKWEKTEYLEKETTRKRRPQLEQLLKDAAARRFDVVIVWKLDRFGRSVRELVANIEALDRAGVRFIAKESQIDTDQRNPASRLLLHVLASVAEFERDLIRDRVTAGVHQHRAMVKAGRIGKDRHTRSGRDLPIGRQPKIFDRQRAREMRLAGASIRKIASEFGVSVGTIHGLIKSPENTVQ
jgi:putative DNA-invertase from lambdoid prophage Rac